MDRIGSSKSIPVDVRVIAATNRNLKQMIDKNQFREDLYYRINVIPIEIPPLRNRKEDLLVLSKHFSKKYATLLTKTIESFSAEAIACLNAYNWPGNIRELENAIENAANIETGNFIFLFSLPPDICNSYFPALEKN